MKSFFLFAFLAVLSMTVSAWDKDDHEIFDLVSALEAAEGKGTTFYSWLDVPHTASTSEIAKAYRKMSMQLHPDKNPGVNGVAERFARLGVISSILRNQESRKRYDFFYKNGVPKWRGTGYYYQRFRPGLGSVLVFLTIFTSGLHYVVQSINYNRDLRRIDRFMREARAAAWGPKMVPIEGKRKVKVNLGGHVRDDGDGVTGKVIDMVVEGQNVYILDPAGELHPLDATAATRPAITNTWFLALVKLLSRKVLDGTKGLDAPEPDANGVAEIVDDGEESSTSTSETLGSGSVTPKDSGKGRGMPVSKAGGKRRSRKR